MWKLVACAANTFRRQRGKHARTAGMSGSDLGARPSWMLWEWGRCATGCCSTVVDVVGLGKGCHWVLLDRHGCYGTGEGLLLGPVRSSWMLCDWGRGATECCSIVVDVVGLGEVCHWVTDTRRGHRGFRSRKEFVTRVARHLSYRAYFTQSPPWVCPLRHPACAWAAQ